MEHCASACLRSTAAIGCGKFSDWTSPFRLQQFLQAILERRYLLVHPGIAVVPEVQRRGSAFPFDHPGRRAVHHRLRQAAGDHARLILDGKLKAGLRAARTHEIFHPWRMAAHLESR